tara:strand:- start:303 stop:1721 length:1419 start_codon:yes stop_codon:yes gene_type:complete
MNKISEKKLSKIKFLFFLIFTLFIFIIGCSNDEVDKAVKKIDLPKAEKNISASTEEIKKNIETVVRVITEKPVRRKLRKIQPSPTPSARLWPVIKIIEKNEPRKIIYETTTQTIETTTEALDKTARTLEKTLDKTLELISFKEKPQVVPQANPITQKVNNNFRTETIEDLSELSNYIDMGIMDYGTLGSSKKDGLQWGRELIGDGELFHIGAEHFEHMFSIASIGNQIGYFYSGGGYSNPKVNFGNIVEAPSLCGRDHIGYEGLITQYGNWSSIDWGGADGPQDASFDKDVYTVSFGTRDSDCYQGQLFFRQGGKIGFFDPIKITSEGKLLLNWWLLDEGFSDINRKDSFEDLNEQEIFFKDFFGPQNLYVEVEDANHYSGDYTYHSNINYRQMWVNEECGELGTKYQNCYIFWYQDINGARSENGELIDQGTWVLQPVLPSHEWNAHAYTDAEWPWGGGWSDSITQLTAHR